MHTPLSPVVILIALLMASPAMSTQTPNANGSTSNPVVQTQDDAKQVKLSALEQAIVDAFKETHDGWSSDEVILQTKLNASFIAAAKKQIGALPDGPVKRKTEAELNWKLLSLRKAGKLNVKTTKRANSNTKDVTHIAEMAMRTVQDKHAISSDLVMTDPAFRDEFDKLVREISDKAELYAVRKAAFQLRKTRRLKPELISRIADWGREIKTYSTAELKKRPESVPPNPGIYIFRDETGYLYIGQTEDLRKRLIEHLDESHNLSLAKYLAAENKPTVEIHSFDPKSRAKEVRIRRAYESELIASRKPRFNIQP